MARIYVCDACGHQFKISEKEYEGVSGIYAPYIKKEGAEGKPYVLDTTKMDLCVGCLRKMAESLKRDNVVVRFDQVKQFRAPNKKKEDTGESVGT